MLHIIFFAIIKTALIVFAGIGIIFTIVGIFNIDEGSFAVVIFTIIGVAFVFVIWAVISISDYTNMIRIAFYSTNNKTVCYSVIKKSNTLCKPSNKVDISKLTPNEWTKIINLKQTGDKP